MPYGRGVSCASHNRDQTAFATVYRNETVMAHVSRRLHGRPLKLNSRHNCPLDSSNAVIRDSHPSHITACLQYCRFAVRKVSALRKVSNLIPRRLCGICYYFATIDHRHAIARRYHCGVVGVCHAAAVASAYAMRAASVTSAAVSRGRSRRRRMRSRRRLRYIQFRAVPSCCICAVS